MAVVDIVRGLAMREAVDDLDGLAAALHIVIGHMSEGTYAGSISGGLGLIRPSVNLSAILTVISTGASSYSPAL